MLVYCLELLGYHNIVALQIDDRLHISNSVARQLFLYTKNSSRKMSVCGTIWDVTLLVNHKLMLIIKSTKGADASVDFS